MLSEATEVAANGHGYPNTPGIYTADQMEAWKPVVKAVQDKGTVFFCQLWHCGRASHSKYNADGALCCLACVFLHVALRSPRL
jgi:12-oxophytodienoic acid reductase